jgi:hypothetical protein
LGDFIKVPGRYSAVIGGGTSSSENFIDLLSAGPGISKTLGGDVMPSMNQCLRKVIHTQLSDID